MLFDPSKWFLGSLEVFGALVPGSIIIVGGAQSRYS